MHLNAIGANSNSYLLQKTAETQVFQNKEITHSDDQNPSHPVFNLSTKPENVQRSPLRSHELADTQEVSKQLDKKNYETDLLMESPSGRDKKCVQDVHISDPIPNVKLEKLLNTLRATTDENKVLIRKTMKKCFKGKQICPRSSRYRGVSKNGALWQVSII